MKSRNLVEVLSKERLGLGGNVRGGYLQDRWRRASSLYSMDLLSHYGCVNAVEWSSCGEWLVSAGDDRRVLLWNVGRALAGKGYHLSMAAEHRSNVFCVGVDDSMCRLYSGGNDEQVIVHDAHTGQPLDYFLHEEPVFSISVHPTQPDLFLTACSDGRILLFDMRQPATTEALMIAGFSYAFHAVQFNPMEPRLLVTANQKFGLGLWDVRKPGTCVLKYASRSSMHARFNAAGTQILGLRRRMPPILFNIDSPVHMCEFDHPGYYNSCTMKSGSFCGPNDEFVISGSDDFNIYEWKIPEDETTSWVDRAEVVLRGHRSIVNQVRYSDNRSLLVSAGVEKVVKVWSALPLRPDEEVLASEERTVYSHEDYIGLVLHSETLAPHDTMTQTTSENPRMMAFFDSLVQREVEGWGSEEDSQSQSSNSGSTSGDSETGVSEFSHHSIGTRRRMLMERISVSIADDLMREDRSIAEARNTVGENVLNSSIESTDTSALDSSILDTSGEVAVPFSAAPAELEPATNRISELIARKRANLVKAARRRGKRLRMMPEAVLLKSLEYAKRVVRVSSTDSRSSTSDEELEDEKSSPSPSSSPCSKAVSSPSSGSSSYSPQQELEHISELSSPDSSPPRQQQSPAGHQLSPPVGQQQSPTGHQLSPPVGQQLSPDGCEEIITHYPVPPDYQSRHSLPGEGSNRTNLNGSYNKGLESGRSVSQELSSRSLRSNHVLSGERKQKPGTGQAGYSGLTVSSVKRGLEKPPDLDREEEREEFPQSLVDLLPGSSKPMGSKFIRSLREKRLRISQGLVESDSDTDTQPA